jgi:hypothetical protein
LAVAVSTDCDQIGVAQSMKHEVQNYTAEIFQPYCGQVFVFQGTSDVSVRLQLAEVKESKSGALPAGFRDPFSLLFIRVGGESSSSGLYRLLHDDFESGDWFLSRVAIPGGDSSIPYYEAVFA